MTVLWFEHKFCYSDVWGVQEKDDKGERVFRGPRVRMGIHWAVEGTVANRFAPSLPSLALHTSFPCAPSLPSLGLHTSLPSTLLPLSHITTVNASWCHQLRRLRHSMHNDQPCEMSLVCKLCLVTKHRAFSRSGCALAQELGHAAGTRQGLLSLGLGSVKHSLVESSWEQCEVRARRSMHDG